METEQPLNKLIAEATDDSGYLDQLTNKPQLNYTGLPTWYWTAEMQMPQAASQKMRLINIALGPESNEKLS